MEDLRRSHIGQMFVFGSLLSTSLTIDNLLTLPFRHIKVTTDKPILRFSCGNNNAITLTAYIYPNTETTSCLSNKTDVFKYKIKLSSCYLCLSIVKITGVSVFVSSQVLQNKLLNNIWLHKIGKVTVCIDDIVAVVVAQFFIFVFVRASCIVHP